MADLYRPSNALEGLDFQVAWCDECRRDANQDCPILARTMILEIDHPDYPKEWVYAAEGPVCLAFDAAPPPRATTPSAVGDDL